MYGGVAEGQKSSSIRVPCVVTKSIVCSVVTMFAESIALPVIGLSAIEPSALDL